MPHNIGQKLSRLRGDTPRKQVALDLGISYSALQMYENGYRIPRDDIKVKIAKYYGKTVGEIFYAQEQHRMRN